MSLALPAVRTYDDDLSSPHMMELREMLTYRRPAGSATESDFIQTYIDPLKPYADNYGNLFVVVGNKSSVIWSSHTDTIHSHEGIQRVSCERKFAFTIDPDSSCLGADCTTGVWIMVEMIKAKVPGLYIFHREEETGAGGSRHIAKTMPDLLRKYNFAIAFDRKGTNSIITRQMSDQCCSKKFARSMCPLLPKGYRVDGTGVFTDTANYTSLVGECTNISVGYYNQHTKSEVQDMPFASTLRNAMIRFDETALIAARTPAPRRIPKYIGFGKAQYPIVTTPTPSNVTPLQPEEDYTKYRRARSVREFCARNAGTVADILTEYGYDVANLYKEYPDAF